MSRSIVVIGAGIVGSAVAAFLSEAGSVEVTVVERGPRERLLGSTGHAPGLVGLLNETAIGTRLARASAHEYVALRRNGTAGFDRVGGIELALTEVGMA